MTKITAEQFIEVWQKAANRKEVAEVLGMKRTTVEMRAQFYRKRCGIPLKKMPRSDLLDIPKLKALAERLAP